MTTKATSPPIASGSWTNRRTANWSWLRDRTVNSRSTGTGAAIVAMDHAGTGVVPAVAALSIGDLTGTG